MEVRYDQRQFTIPFCSKSAKRKRDSPVSDRHENLQVAVENAKGRVGVLLNNVWWWYMVRGMLAVCLAFVALFWPQQTIPLLIHLLGVYLLLDGLIGLASLARSVDWKGRLVGAMVGIGCGLALLVWADLTIRLFLTLIGIWAVLQGASLYWSSRSQGPDADTRSALTTAGIVLAIAGVVLLVWPATGVIAISWLLAVVSGCIGALMLFIAMRLRIALKRVSSSSN